MKVQEIFEQVVSVVVVICLVVMVFGMLVEGIQRKPSPLGVLLFFVSIVFIAGPWLMYRSEVHQKGRYS
ncbi:hypothetical protein LCGC14_2929420, partial [marine sediment metagenome]